MDKQTHLCPHHRRTQKYFSPFLLSGGELVFLSHSDTCWVLQPDLGNCLVWLISFAGKTGSFPPCPGFTQVCAILKIKPVVSQFPWSLLHGKDLPLPSWSHRDLQQSLGWLCLRGVSSPPEHQQQSLYSTALDPDCRPLSFLTSRAVFCHPAPEKRLLEGPAPGWGQLRQWSSPAWTTLKEMPPGDVLRLAVPTVWLGQRAEPTRLLQQP